MKAGAKVLVEIDLGDSLKVGLSLRSVAQRGGIPADAIAAYDRVGKLLIAASTSGGVENPPVEVVS